MNDSNQMPGEPRPTDVWRPPPPPRDSTGPQLPPGIEVPPEPHSRTAVPGHAAVRQSTPVPAQQPASPNRPSRGGNGSGAKRTRTVAGLVGVLVVGLVALGGYFLISRDGEDSKEATLDTNEASTPASSVASSTLSPDQQAAVDDAESYLEFSSPPSRAELIKHLTTDGAYTEADAAVAVDSLGLDWIEQATLLAKSYLRTGSFSRSGLVDQLIYNEFTPDEAAAGVDGSNGDWNGEAVETAEGHIKYNEGDAYSCNEMISILINKDGFTDEQAEYGAAKSGLC